MSEPTIGMPKMPKLSMVEMEYRRSSQVPLLSPVQWAASAPEPTNVDLVRMNGRFPWRPWRALRDDVLHPLSVDLLEEGQQLRPRVVHGVEGEVLGGVHVVVVVPDDVQGDPGLLVRFDDALHHRDGMGAGRPMREVYWSTTPRGVGPEKK
ncbi:unnamed protein product [Spirodela intermedia]|uniref:Uncharacterized protein n=1 Tax=Spirodela intermedia TaxID=51605 RepID=A0A7I8JMJ9_SPIIN|nr:unnamed protein product [Spirodela intermedia]CAA6671387.1 unnamed protein product [Spirodela intermedia]